MFQVLQIFSEEYILICYMPLFTRRKNAIKLYFHNTDKSASSNLILKKAEIFSASVPLILECSFPTELQWQIFQNQINKLYLMKAVQTEDQVPALEIQCRFAVCL